MSSALVGMRASQYPGAQLALAIDDEAPPPGAPAAIVPASRPDRADPGGRRIASGPARALPPESANSFELFVAAHQALGHAYVAGVLRGETGIDPEAVVQEALMRVWAEWTRWPRSPERRVAYLKRALLCRALDALRARRGRGGRPRELATDVVVVERRSHDPADVVAERLALVNALAGLTDAERRAVCLSAQGYPDREIAAQLQVSAQRVRTVLMDARALLRSLLDHADHAGPPTDPQDACAPFADPATTRGRRLVRRHLQHCPSCRPDSAADVRR